MQKICALQQPNEEEGGKRERGKSRASKQAIHAMDCRNNKLYKFIVDQADNFAIHTNKYFHKYLYLFFDLVKQLQADLFHAYCSIYVCTTNMCSEYQMNISD